jgi:gas vesicle protein
MNNKQIIFPFIAGVAAGAAAGYYLNSDKGRVQVAEAKETVKDASSQAQEALQHQLGALQNQMQHAISSIQTQLDQIKTAGEARIDNGKERVLDKTIEMADGIKTKAKAAKAKLN